MEDDEDEDEPSALLEISDQEQSDTITSSEVPTLNIRHPSPKSDEDNLTQEYEQHSSSDESIKQTVQRKKVSRKITKIPWTSEEKQAVLSFFRNTIAKRKPVHKVPAEKCIASNSCLQRRTWLNLRDFVRNHIRKLSKFE